VQPTQNPKPKQKPKTKSRRPAYLHPQQQTNFKTIPKPFFSGENFFHQDLGTHAPEIFFPFLRENSPPINPPSKKFNNFFVNLSEMPVPRNAGEIFAVLGETQLLVMRSGELRAILNFFRSYFDVGSCRLLLFVLVFGGGSSRVRRSEEV
jgi:hypothetical protein